MSLCFLMSSYGDVSTAKDTRQKSRTEAFRGGFMGPWVAGGDSSGYIPNARGLFYYQELAVALPLRVPLATRVYGAA